MLASLSFLETIQFFGPHFVRNIHTLLFYSFRSLLIIFPLHIKHVCSSCATRFHEVFMNDLSAQFPPPGRVLFSRVIAVRLNKPVGWGCCRRLGASCLRFDYRRVVAFRAINWWDTLIGGGARWAIRGTNWDSVCHVRTHSPAPRSLHINQTIYK